MGRMDGLCHRWESVIVCWMPTLSIDGDGYTTFRASRHRVVAQLRWFTVDDRSAFHTRDVATSADLWVSRKTRQALAASLWGDAQIVAAKRMTANALGLASLQRRWSETAKDVHALCDGFQVFDADATMITAQMIDSQSCGDFADERFPDPPMRHLAHTVVHDLNVAHWWTGQPSGDGVAGTAEVDPCQHAGRQNGVCFGIHRWVHSLGVGPGGR